MAFRAGKKTKSMSRPAPRGAPFALSPIQKRRKLRESKKVANEIKGKEKDISPKHLHDRSHKILHFEQGETPLPVPQHCSQRRIGTRRQRTREQVLETTKRINNIKMLENVKWLEKRGVGSMLRRRLQYDKYMKDWFDFLDADESGDIGVDELEEPLISLGLAHSRRETEALVKLYDQDGDMELSYEEFKMLLQGKQRKIQKRIPLKDRKYKKKIVYKTKVPVKTTENQIDAMFDQISSGRHGDHNIPLDMSISNYRRKLLMDANMSPRDDDKRKGLLVLKGILNSRNPTEGALNASPHAVTTSAPLGRRQSMFQRLKQKISEGTL